MTTSNDFKLFMLEKEVSSSLRGEEGKVPVNETVAVDVDCIRRGENGILVLTSRVH